MPADGGISIKGIAGWFGRLLVSALKDEVKKDLQERGIWRRVKHFLLREKEYPVLLLGSTGVGKTAIFNALQGIFEPIDRESGRTARDMRVRGDIDGSPFEFIDSPGQLEHRERLRKIVREAARRQPLGIINVVSYGYHETREIEGYPAPVVDSHPAAEFLKKCREEAEIGELPLWTEVLAEADWLITVVSKADLWWTPEEEKVVFKHYRNGSYANALGSSKRLGGIVLPYSSFINPFYDVAKGRGVYSEQLKARHAVNFVAQLLEVASGKPHRRKK